MPVQPWLTPKRLILKLSSDEPLVGISKPIISVVDQAMSPWSDRKPDNDLAPTRWESRWLFSRWLFFRG